jgi:hypothetical protein
MGGNLKIIRKIALIILILGIFIVCLLPFGVGAVTGIITGYREGYRSKHWRDHTKPINSEIANDLCQKLNISKEEHVCKSNEIVYGPEFYPYIIDYFCPKKNECTNEKEVEEKIGLYKYSEDAKDGLMPGESSRNWYDFQTDHMYPLIITFYTNGTIERIQYDFGD